MQDLACLESLLEQLEDGLKNQDVELVLSLCEQHDQFIRSITPSSENTQLNETIRRFVDVHSLAVAFIQEAHSVMQKELFQSTQNRKSVSKYQGVKYAE